MADVETRLSNAEKIARVREAYQASERGDLEKGAEILADDAVFHSQLRQHDFRGRAAILAEQLNQREEFKPEYKLHDVAASDDHVVALMEVTQEIDGKRQTGRLVHVMHVNDEGKVKEVWAVYNPQA